MDNFDALAPNYRRAQQRWPSAPTLAMCYSALGGCFSSGVHGLVEHAKSFIESVCLTIMGELGEPMPSSTPSTTDLLVAALGSLGLRNTRGASKLDKVLSAFNRMADALSEMRDENGAVAHGKDGFLDSITADHARAFLHVGDAVLGVLLNALEGKQPDLSVTREPYESFPHHNERIDGAVTVKARIDEDGEVPIVVLSVAMGSGREVIELRAEPSRLLYGIDRDAYVDVLETVRLVVVEAEEETEGAEEMSVPEAVEAPHVGATAEAGPVTALVPEYAGVLSAFRSGLEAFLRAEGVESGAPAGEAQLIDSLLATVEENIGLDWKEREAIQARLKVVCKRVLVRFGSVPEEAEDVAKRLVAWLRVQVGSVGAIEAGAASGGMASE